MSYSAGSKENRKSDLRKAEKTSLSLKKKFPKQKSPPSTGMLGTVLPCSSRRGRNCARSSIGAEMRKEIMC